MEKKFKPETKEELKKLTEDENINLGSIDTSLTTDMSELFYDSKREDFSGIETWDTSKVVNMESMFFKAESFNQPLNNWNVSNVENMIYMFYGAKSFNQALNSWDTSNVTDMIGMFSGALEFNQSLNNWNTSKVVNMESMFFKAESFNQSLNNWNISKLRYIDYMFNSALNFDKNNALEFYLKFCSDKNTQKAIKELDSIVSELDVKKFYKLALKYNKKSVAEVIKKLENTHYGELKELIEIKEDIIEEYKKSEKNKKLKPEKEDKIYQPKDKKELIKLIEDKIKFNKIDTSLITDMSGLFENSRLRKFDGIETWDTSNVVNMESMFEYAVYFNHNINNWNVSKVRDMSDMFMDAKRFNQPLDSWNTSNVKNMSRMFWRAKSFNQNINNWNTSNAEDMSYMFYETDNFNQPLDNWDTSNVKNMYGMFFKAESFNQDLNSWNTNNLQDTNCMFKYSPMQDNMPSWYKSIK